MYQSVEDQSEDHLTEERFGDTSSEPSGVRPEGSHWDGPKLRRQVLSSAKQSFGVECSDSIEAHGARRRDIAGRDRDGGKYKGDPAKVDRSVGRHAVEQFRHEKGGDERTGHTIPARWMHGYPACEEKVDLDLLSAPLQGIIPALKTSHLK